MTEPTDAVGPPPEPPPRGAAPGDRGIRRVVEWVVVLVGAVAIMLVVQATSLQVYRIPSSSMAPTLRDGDRVAVNKWSYRLHDVNRGDIVVFNRPDDPSITEAHLVKRVVGLPGETVTITNDHVLIDGQVLDEGYLPAGTVTDAIGTHPCPPSDPCRIPEAQVWVMGDNRSNSMDSRFFGPLPESKIVGRAFLRLWPPTRLSGL